MSKFILIRQKNTGRLCLIGSQDGRDGSVTLHQDVSLYATLLGQGVRVEYSCAPGRLAWVQVARGSLKLNEYVLSAGDGAALTNPRATIAHRHGDGVGGAAV
jgi:redox-sensitive bicupin YhaK (pirin superfamily)